MREKDWFDWIERRGAEGSATFALGNEMMAWLVGRRRKEKGSLLMGRKAVELYRKRVVLEQVFGWWGGISGRRVALRRNLGVLSRLR